MSKITVFRIVSRGHLPFYEFGKARPYKLSDVEKYAEERRTGAWRRRYGGPTQRA